MALTTEIIITLQQLKEIGIKGIGTKSILEIGVSCNANTIEDLTECWKTLRNTKYEKISIDSLLYANKLAKKIINACNNEQIGIISFYEEIFPEILRNCLDESGHLAPPLVLYYRGDLEALKKPGIAVIGTREPTMIGEKAGKVFASIFAQNGFNIVSGLAIGCDTAGHKGALGVGGTTTAFLATDLKWENIYPKENLQLAQNIANNGGLLLSEYYIGQKCGKYAFVNRDRLQAGLSYATIAVQTGVKGGTMHAINATLKSGKPLFMVKYNSEEELKSPQTQGNINLLKTRVAQPIGSQNVFYIIGQIRDHIKRIQTSLL